GQELRDATGVGQVERLPGHLVLEGDLQSAVDVTHVLQAGLDDLRVEVRGLEDLRVGLEIDDRPVAAGGANFFKVRSRLAAPVGLPPLAAVGADGGDELLRQGVDDGGADAVQTAGVEVVVVVAELAAGVQHGQDHFQAGPLELGVDIDGDAAAVVLHGDG